MIQFLLDLLFPRRCLACNKSGAYFCTTCRPLLKPAQIEDPELNQFWAGFNYDDPAIKKAIWRLKYSGQTSLAEELASILAERLQEELAELMTFAGEQKILLLPIPLSKSRQKTRGYNQADLLARALTKKQKEVLEYSPNILIKIKDTPAQVTLKKRAARLANLNGAFIISNPEKIKNRTVIILDDVLTTGATLSEAVKVIQKNGAETVLGAALAHRE